MAQESGNVNYQRGVAPLVLLALLKQEDMYGYQLVQEMEAKTDGAVCMQEGSLYPVLYRLQDAGYISSKRVLVGKRMTRVYYHIEPSGEEHLKKLVKEYTAVTDGVFKIIHKEGKKAR